MRPKIILKPDGIQGIPEDLPFVSIIIPFQPKMNSKTGFEFVVNTAAGEAEKELMRNYPEEKASPVVKKMYLALKRLNCKLHSKSIGIFVSPLTEKVYYFNYTVPSPDNY